MLRRYKEIIFGLLLGLAIWVMDAMMHAQLGADVHSSGSFANEIFHPGSTPFVFRVGFLVIAVAFGWALRIVSHARMLQGTTSVTRDDMAMSLSAAIGDDAQTIDHLAQQYIHFSEQVRDGRASEAIETLQSIEAWLRQKRATASSSTTNTQSSLR